MNTYFQPRIITLFLLFFISFIAYSEDDFIVYSELHDIKVINLDSYETKHVISGKIKGNRASYFTIYLNETSELLEYSLFEIKGGKKKKVKISNNLIVSTLDFSSFFNGSKKYSFLVEPNIDFEISYTTKEKHSIFLSKFFRKGYYDSKDVKYIIHIPENLQLSIRNKKEMFGPELTIDSTFFRDTSAFIPYLIHPKTQSAYTYFSSWFMDKINVSIQIEKTNLPSELKFRGDESQAQIASSCFNYVKKNIKYLDIENGINAVVPRPCQAVLDKKMGDCKDMANLLVNLLKLNGIEAYHGVSRTFQKDDTLNFPSIGLANHMIAVARIDGEWYFLDATERACLFGDPSIQILGTEVLLLNNPMTNFLNVPSELRSKTELSFEYYYKKSKENQLELKLTSKGKLNLLFATANSYDVIDTIQLFTYFKEHFKLNWEMISFEISDTVSVFELQTRLPDSYISSIGKKQFVNLDFILTPKEISLIFFQTPYPLYANQVQFSILHEGKCDLNTFLKTDSNYFTFKTESNRINWIFPFEKENSKKAFFDSLINKEFKNQFQKPISIVYE
jgi:hypothetical protein